MAGHWQIYVMDCRWRIINEDLSNDRSFDLIGIPHGLRTVNTLPLLLLGIGTLWLEPGNLRDGRRWGGNPRRLSNNFFDDWNPSWSPDGKRIAFTSSRDGNQEIHVMDADGGNQRNLTNKPRHDDEPSWSPDGKRITFARAGRNREIYVMDADGGNQRNLTNNPRSDSQPSWSPDGKHIAFVSNRDGNREIYVINADGAGQTQRLTNSRRNDIDPAWFDPAFAVAPAGKKITIWGSFKQVVQ